MKYILSVSEINKYIKEIVSRDLILSNLWVKGEMSNFKSHSSGHMYFTIKDQSSILKCVMFRSNASCLKFIPENGMKVIIRGYVSIFERDGQYQLYVEDMQPDGVGALYIAFEQLKKKLEDEGIFDVSFKKQMPLLPETIGVITSPTGAVIRDILNVLNRRFGNYRLVLFPVAVQGELAGAQISRAIKKINEARCADVIIIARGGGSIEELWAFNEEVVARSIFKSNIPVISAVGHETDYTIADFAADLRAPTPSAAAEMVLPEKALLLNKLASLNIRMRSSLIKSLDVKRAYLESIKNSSAFRQPYDRVYQARMQLDLLNKYMLKAMKMILERKKSEFGLIIGKLDALSPLTVLARGYGIIKSSTNNKVIKTIEDVNVDDEVDISFKDGNALCIIREVEKGRNYGRKEKKL